MKTPGTCPLRNVEDCPCREVEHCPLQIDEEVPCWNPTELAYRGCTMACPFFFGCFASPRMRKGKTE